MILLLNLGAAVSWTWDLGVLFYVFVFFEKSLTEIFDCYFFGNCLKWWKKNIKLVLNKFILYESEFNFETNLKFLHEICIHLDADCS